MCGSVFTKRTPYHRYCSQSCRSRAQERKLNKQHALSAFAAYEFECRNCGCHVVVTDPADHRSVYCSAACERSYWRRVTKRPTALTVRYASEMEAAELRDAS